MVALLLLILTPAWAAKAAKPPPPPPAEEAAEDPGSLRRSNRVEFDERLVRGQTAQSGAVYLFDRAPRELPGLVALRRSYRDRIVEPILGDRPLAPATYSDLRDEGIEFTTIEE